MVKKILKGGTRPVKVWTHDLDPQAELQLLNTANLPFIFKHIAVMPDVHVGLGATVGSVIPTEGAIIPAAVGVDIGCGMSAVKLPVHRNKIDNDKLLRRIRKEIESLIPVGIGNGGEHRKTASESEKILHRLGLPKTELSAELLKKALRQIGTLGGGNHFIEVCFDQDHQLWAVLHSGSRHVGNKLAMNHIQQARGLFRESLETLGDLDLAYFSQHTPEFEKYIQDLFWAQAYAKANRLEMMSKVLQVLIKELKLGTSPRKLMKKSFIDCHHNYTELEHHFGKDVYITRKGAVRARSGDLGIIPGSMGAKSYIVEGKGNPDSFCSCSHGAGRQMSRSKARKIFSTKDLEEQTKGIECRKDSQIVDEIPSAYKDIDEVMENQKDLVTVRHILKQLICVKGS